MTGILFGGAVLAGAYLGYASLPLIAVVWLVAKWLRASTLTLFALLIVGASMGSIRGASVPDGPTELPSALVSVDRVEGNVVSRATMTGSAQRFVVEVDGYRLCADAPLLPELFRDDLIAIEGTITTLESVPDSYQTSVRVRNCSGTIAASSMTIREQGSGMWHTADRIAGAISRSAQRIAPGDRGALLAGLVTGDDAALSSQVRNNFYVTGTSHITAVSGGNLAIIVGLFGGLAARTGGRRGWQRAFAIFVAVWLYAILVGAGPPVIRAAAVASLAACAPPLGRKADLLTLAMLVAAVEAIVTPSVIHGLSFQLSTAAAIALVLAVDRREVRTGAQAAKALLVGSIAAQLATIPVLAATVGMPSPWSLPANMLVVPIVGVTYPLAGIASVIGLVSSELSATIGLIPSAGAGLILWIIGEMASWPGARQISLEGHSTALALLTIGCLLGLGMVSREFRGGAHRVVRDATLARGESGWLVLAVACGVVMGSAAMIVTR